MHIFGVAIATVIGERDLFETTTINMAHEFDFLFVQVTPSSLHFNDNIENINKTLPFTRSLFVATKILKFSKAPYPSALCHIIFISQSKKNESIMKGNLNT